MLLLLCIVFGATGESSVVTVIRVLLIRDLKTQRTIPVLTDIRLQVPGGTVLLILLLYYDGDGRWTHDA